MKKSLFGFGVLIALGMLVSVPVQAKELKERKGFLIGLDVGGGGLSLDGLDKGAFFAGFKIGGGFNERILLMGEGFNAVTEVNDDTTNVGGIALASQVFVHEQFYVRPGVGFAVLHTDTGPVTTETDTGFAALLSSGYEFRLTKRFALSPEARFAYSRIEGGDYFWYGVAADVRWYF